MKATVTFDVSELEVELFKENLEFYTEEVDLDLLLIEYRLSSYKCFTCLGM